MKHAVISLVLAALCSGCCGTKPPRLDPRPSPPPLPDRAMIRDLGTTGPVSGDAFLALAGCYARVGEHYNIVDEKGFLARGVVESIVQAPQSGCGQFGKLSFVTAPSRPRVGKVAIFGPVNEDFPSARLLLLSEAVTEHPPIDPELGWELLAAVDLDGDSQGDLFWFAGSCGTGGHRLCELTQLRAPDGWYVVGSYLAEDAPARMKVPIVTGSLRVSPSYFSAALARFRKEFPIKTTGALNGPVERSIEVEDLFKVLAANYEMAPPTGSGTTISRESIRKEITAWYTGISADEQYRFLYLVNDLSSLRLAADLSTSLAKPQEMESLPEVRTP